jgi:hypothetical protein
MNRNQKGARRRRQVLRLWNRPQAQAALPYISSIVRSLREHWLEAQTHRLDLSRLKRRPGRPDRASLIAEQTAERAVREAEARFQHALEELQALDIYCLDPARGEVLIPFLQENQLAWFVYDLFEEQPLNSWRYHSDPLEARRSLAELREDSAGNTRIV